MVICELIKSTADLLRQSGNDNPVFEAHQLVRHVLKLSATDLVLKHDQPAAPDDIRAIEALTKRRISGEPLQYILDTQEFMSLEFIVSPDVLIPRADTETLVEYVIEKMQGKGFTLLDIGTGTGCIPLSIAHFNKRAFVRGLDISKKALDIAHQNCRLLSLEDRADFEFLDILSSVPRGKYDIISSNPPYIKHDVIPSLDTSVKDFEPSVALDGGLDGLDFYRRICNLAPRLLNKKGRLIFEIGFDQGDDVVSLMNNDFYDIEVIKDLCGNDRVVTGIIK